MRLVQQTLNTCVILLSGTISHISVPNPCLITRYIHVSISYISSPERVGFRSD